MDDLTPRRAEKLMRAGLEAVAAGDIAKGREKFKASSEQLPTAEAFTYWGWMEHHLGNTPAAIELCHRAIEADPDFGNPYNDIGSYLIAQGSLDEAIGWLEKAVAAARYEPRHYPHLNLGRVFLSKEMPERAAEEFRKALAFAPDNAEILQMLAQVLRPIS